MALGIASSKCFGNGIEICSAPDNTWHPLRLSCCAEPREDDCEDYALQGQISCTSEWTTELGNGIEICSAPDDTWHPLRLSCCAEPREDDCEDYALQGQISCTSEWTTAPRRSELREFSVINRPTAHATASRWEAVFYSS